MEEKSKAVKEIAGPKESEESEEIINEWCYLLHRSKFDSAVNFSESLSILSLKHCHIINTDFLSNCVNIKYLDLSHNDLQCVPLNIGKLKCLQFLHLTANYITTFYDLDALKQLRCCYSQIDYKGTKISCGLLYLNLEDNPVTRIARYRDQVLRLILSDQIPSPSDENRRSPSSPGEKRKSAITTLRNTRISMVKAFEQVDMQRKATPSPRTSQELMSLSCLHLLALDQLFVSDAERLAVYRDNLNSSTHPFSDETPCLTPFAAPGSAGGVEGVAKQYPLLFFEKWCIPREFVNITGEVVMNQMSEVVSQVSHSILQKGASSSSGLNMKAMDACIRTRSKGLVTTAIAISDSVVIQRAIRQYAVRCRYLYDPPGYVPLIPADEFDTTERKSRKYIVIKGVILLQGVARGVFWRTRWHRFLRELEIQYDLVREDMTGKPVEPLIKDEILLISAKPNTAKSLILASANKIHYFFIRGYRYLVREKKKKRLFKVLKAYVFRRRRRIDRLMQSQSQCLLLALPAHLLNGRDVLQNLIYRYSWFNSEVSVEYLESSLINASHSSQIARSKQQKESQHFSFSKEVKNNDRTCVHLRYFGGERMVNSSGEFDGAYFYRSFRDQFVRSTLLDTEYHAEHIRDMEGGFGGEFLPSMMVAKERSWLDKLSVNQKHAYQLYLLQSAKAYFYTGKRLWMRYLQGSGMEHRFKTIKARGLLTLLHFPKSESEWQLYKKRNNLKREKDLKNAADIDISMNILSPRPVEESQAQTYPGSVVTDLENPLLVDMDDDSTVSVRTAAPTIALLVVKVKKGSLLHSAQDTPDRQKREIALMLNHLRGKLMRRYAELGIHYQKPLELDKFGILHVAGKLMIDYRCRWMWTEVEVSQILACEIIQRRFRGYLCRRDLFRQSESTWRDFKLKKPTLSGEYFKKLIEHRAAVVIQRFHRFYNGIQRRFRLLTMINDAIKGIRYNTEGGYASIYFDSWVYYQLLCAICKDVMVVKNRLCTASMRNIVEFQGIPEIVSIPESSQDDTHARSKGHVYIKSASWKPDSGFIIPTLRPYKRRATVGSLRFPIKIQYENQNYQRAAYPHETSSNVTVGEPLSLVDEGSAVQAMRSVNTASTTSRNLGGSRFGTSKTVTEANDWDVYGRYNNRKTAGGTRDLKKSAASSRNVRPLNTGPVAMPMPIFDLLTKEIPMISLVSVKPTSSSADKCYRVVELRFQTLVEAKTRCALIILATYDAYTGKSVIPMGDSEVQNRVDAIQTYLVGEASSQQSVSTSYEPPKSRNVSLDHQSVGILDHRPIVPSLEKKSAVIRNRAEEYHFESGQESNMLLRPIKDYPKNIFRVALTRSIGALNEIQLENTMGFRLPTGKPETGKNPREKTMILNLNKTHRENPHSFGIVWHKDDVRLFEVFCYLLKHESSSFLVVSQESPRGNISPRSRSVYSYNPSVLPSPRSIDASGNVVISPRSMNTNTYNVFDFTDCRAYYTKIQTFFGLAIKILSSTRGPTVRDTKALIESSQYDLNPTKFFVCDRSKLKGSKGKKHGPPDATAEDITSIGLWFNHYSSVSNAHSLELGKQGGEMDVSKLNAVSTVNDSLESPLPGVVVKADAIQLMKDNPLLYQDFQRLLQQQHRKNTASDEAKPRDAYQCDGVALSRAPVVLSSLISMRNSLLLWSCSCLQSRKFRALNDLSVENAVRVAKETSKIIHELNVIQAMRKNLVVPSIEETCDDELETALPNDSMVPDTITEGKPSSPKVARILSQPLSKSLRHKRWQEAILSKKSIHTEYRQEIIKEVAEAREKETATKAKVVERVRHEAEDNAIAVAEKLRLKKRFATTAAEKDNMEFEMKKSNMELAAKEQLEEKKLAILEAKNKRELLIRQQRIAKRSMGILSGLVRREVSYAVKSEKNEQKESMLNKNRVSKAEYDEKVAQRKVSSYVPYATQKAYQACYQKDDPSVAESRQLMMAEDSMDADIYDIQDNYILKVNTATPREGIIRPATQGLWKRESPLGLSSNVSFNDEIPSAVGSQITSRKQSPRSDRGTPLHRVNVPINDIPLSDVSKLSGDAVVLDDEYVEDFYRKPKSPNMFR